MEAVGGCIRQWRRNVVHGPHDKCRQLALLHYGACVRAVAACPFVFSDVDRNEQITMVYWCFLTATVLLHYLRRRRHPFLPFLLRFLLRCRVSLLFIIRFGANAANCANNGQQCNNKSAQFAATLVHLTANQELILAAAARSEHTHLRRLNLGDVACRLCWYTRINSLL